MCVYQSYRSLSLSLNTSKLDILIKNAEVDTVGKGGIREYRRAQNTSIAGKLESAFILFPSRP